MTEFKAQLWCFVLLGVDRNLDVLFETRIAMFYQVFIICGVRILNYFVVIHFTGQS
jgi:hypothetical protein